MVALYQMVIYQPLFNILVWLYNVIPGHDVGIAIILLTIVVKLILYPFSLQSIRAQKSMQALQPKLDELKKKYKDDKEKLSQEMMKLYKDEKVNPFSSCLPVLVQLPILIAVYQVLRNGLSNGSFVLLYPFIANPGQIGLIAFGFLDLSKPNMVLAVLAGLAQYWQTTMVQVQQPPKTKDGKVLAGAKDENVMATMNKQMKYTMPLITIIIGFSLPGGLTLYWLIMTLLTVLQQYVVFRKVNKGEKPKNDGNNHPDVKVNEEEIIK